MKALKILIDLNSGEKLHITTVDVDSELFYSNSLDHDEMYEGELVHARYCNDFDPGPEPLDEDRDLYLGCSPEDFLFR